jgi:hypothetical protein
MANMVSITKLLDGPRSAVFHVFIQSDGASGDLTDQVLIDPATSFDPAQAPVPGITIEELWYDLSGFAAVLEFDYLLQDTPVWVLSEGHGDHMDFMCFGGLKDRSPALDGTGKLTITTNGLNTAGDRGSLVIKVRKD